MTLPQPEWCDLMDQYHVYSTDDMIHWKDHSEILRASQVPWGRRQGGFMCAQDCAYKNGKFYFYFQYPWKIGVAVSDKPASDFKVVDYIQFTSINCISTRMAPPKKCTNNFYSGYLLSKLNIY